MRNAPHRPHRRVLVRPARRAAGVIGLAATLALAACAGAQKPRTDEVVWPFPPDKPRIRFVRAFAQESDLRTSGLQKLFRIVTPPAVGEDVREPTSLALSLDEKRLFVASAVRGRVLEIDLASGKFRKAADVEGYRPRQPFGVAFDAQGNLYVSDSTEAVVWVYGPDGKFLRHLGRSILERPTGIAIDRRRHVLYVVEGGGPKSKHHSIEVFSLTGTHLRTIGTRGPEPGNFNFPSYVAVAPDGNVYVSDTLHFRIQVFDPEGQLVTMFGTPGAGPGGFAKVKGLAFDAFGNLHAVDGEAGFVQIFSPRHQPLMAYGGRAARAGFFEVPNAIAIDSKNGIYVADYGGSRVGQYQLFDTTAEDALAESAPLAPAPAPPAGK